jgi:hypothetical protein
VPGFGRLCQPFASQKHGTCDKELAQGSGALRTRPLAGDNRPGRRSNKHRRNSKVRTPDDFDLQLPSPGAED